ncbi:unnamed protein product [Lupinus luteus]|uniref:Uncharacterized protein n=1 Tax=Lupinus luteus TaxID=3873 RepID=A0AAV1WD50_LUPLU
MKGGKSKIESKSRSQAVTNYIFRATSDSCIHMAKIVAFDKTQWRENPKFNFQKYMISALEDDFRKVFGTR